MFYLDSRAFPKPARRANAIRIVKPLIYGKLLKYQTRCSGDNSVDTQVGGST